MSADEMREYCTSLCNFKLRVEVRLKNFAEVMTGHIQGVEAERFQFVDDNNVVQQIRFAWVARIKNA